MHPYLFVYGTLKKGNMNPAAIHLHLHAKWIGEGVMSGRLYQLGDYPGAHYLYGAKEEVKGEVFEMNDLNLLTMLDEYEGIGPDIPKPHEYVRQLCPIRKGEVELLCWVYLYNWPIL